MMMEELCLHIIDIAQNSVSAAAANVRIRLRDSAADNIILIHIGDDGKGMDAATAENVQNPFFTTKSGKKVGLGIPLLKESALFCDGGFQLSSSPGQGAIVSATFRRDHIDTPPVGNIAETIFTLIAGTDQCNIEFTFETDKGAFSISTNEIREQIGADIPLSYPDVIAFLRQYISENIAEVME